MPAFTAETFCPLGARKAILGMVLLGRTLSGRGLSALQREVLAVMAAVLSAHISHHRGVREASRLNESLRRQATANARLLREMEANSLDAVRALAAADAFDAMTTDRPYRERFPLVHALREIDANARRQFDPAVVGALFRAVRA